MKSPLRERISLWLERLFEQSKLAIATRLHNASPARYCWADCVAYSVSSERANPLKIDGGAACKSESLEKGACYCGAWCKGVTWSSMSEAERAEATCKAEPGSILFD